MINFKLYFVTSKMILWIKNQHNHGRYCVLARVIIHFNVYNEKKNVENISAKVMINSAEGEKLYSLRSSVIFALASSPAQPISSMVFPFPLPIWRSGWTGKRKDITETEGVLHLGCNSEECCFVCIHVFHALFVCDPNQGFQGFTRAAISVRKCTVIHYIWELMSKSLENHTEPIKWKKHDKYYALVWIYISYVAPWDAHSLRHNWFIHTSSVCSYVNKYIFSWEWFTSDFNHMAHLNTLGISLTDIHARL